MKVLIVDDEPIIRQVLRTMIPWEEHGLAWGGEATDGVEALERMKQGDIDLVVTDILMPRMDGLELVKRIKQSESDTAIIVLSCLDDFMYVREAMKQGARDYILKPTMEPDQLAAILTEAKSALEEQREAAARHRQLQLALQQTKQAQWGMRVKLVWLHGGKPDKEFETAWFQEGSTLISCILYFKSAVRLSYMNWQWADALACVALNEQQLLLLYREDPSDPCAAEETVTRFLSGPDGVEPDSFLMTQVTGIRSAGLLVQVKQEHELLYKQLFYDEMEASVLTKAVEAGVDGQAIEAGAAWSMPQEEKQNLLRAIGGHNEPAIAFWSQQLLQVIRRQRPPVEQVYLFIHELLGLGAAMARQHAFLPMPEVPEGRSYTLMEAQSHLRMDSLGSWFTSACLELAGAHAGDLSNSRNPFVHKALAYMKRNYHLPISTTDIAEYVKLSRSYLSDLYGKETGESLIEALTRIRMEAAKHLLLQPSRKVYEVAEAVGFTDSKTFAKTFKKATGFTPKEYEEQFR